MNKKELIMTMAEIADLPRVTAEKALNAFIEAVTEALKEGDKVTLVGFGTFSVSQRAERMVRNPRSGEKMKIPARKVVKFKPARKLNERVG